MRVRAENAAGAGPWSPVARLRPGLPAAVSAPTLDSGDARLRVRFTAVSGNGSPNSSYDVAYCSVSCDSSDSHWQRKSVAARDAGTAIGYWLFDLANGTTYQVRVRGNNRHGSGRWSPTETAVPGVPAAPAAPTLRGGDHKIVVDWAPPGDHGSAISDYDVRYCSSGCSSDADWTSLEDTTDSTDRPAVIDGLSIGSAYQVQVRAQNARGVGPWSAAGTHTVTTSPVPSRALLRPCAPGGVTQLWVDNSCYIKAGLGGIKPFDDWTLRDGAGDYVRLGEHPHLGILELTAYNPLGGAAVIETIFEGAVQEVFVVDVIRFAIRDYSITHSGSSAELKVWLASPDNFSPDILTRDGADYARSWIELSLPEALRGATHDGDNPLGPWTRTPKQVVGQYGDVITIPLLVLSQGSHTIDIDAYRPAPDADCPLTGPIRCFAPPEPGRQISFTTSAEATATFQSGNITPPGTPSSVSVVRSAGSLEVSWPAVSGATGYHITYSSNGGVSWDLAAFDHRSAGISISGVDDSATYLVGVRAHNPSGGSNWRNSSPVAPLPTSPPGTPSSVSVTRSAGVLEVSWPAVSGATGYHITYSSNGGGSWQLAAFDHGSAGISISGVDDSATYLVGVRAMNSVGGSNWRNSSSAAPFVPSPPPQPPGTPSSVSVTRSVWRAGGVVAGGVGCDGLSHHLYVRRRCVVAARRVRSFGEQHLDQRCG